MTEKGRKDFAVWLCWAHNNVGRQIVLADFKRQYGDEEHASLVAVLVRVKKRWDAKPEVEREMFANKQRQLARAILHKTEAA